MVSIARKTRTRVARREGSNGVVMQRGLWCFIPSDKMQVGADVQAPTVFLTKLARAGNVFGLKRAD